MFLIFLFLVFLCWGSFLNVVAYRLIMGQNILYPRSSCPNCSNQIAWYDNIPVLSWIILKGKCRSCRHTISLLYPFIELLTAFSLLALYTIVPHIYFYPYFIFFSALIITIRSDLERMLISQFVTIFLIPLGLLFSWLGWLPIAVANSLLGAVIGYGFLFLMSKIFYFFTGKEGIGQGDLELLGFIGSFIGIAGCWISLFLGSFIGALAGLLYIRTKKEKRYIKIPFGPFLALGAINFVLFSDTLKLLILRI